MTTLTCELSTRSQVEVLAWIESQTKRETDALGFIPRAGIQRHHATARVLAAMEGEKPIGFAVFGGTSVYTKIFQIYVGENRRREGVGRELLAHIGAIGIHRDRPYLRARVAADLHHISFWDRIGWSRIRIGPGGDRRGRLIILFGLGGLTPQRSLFPDGAWRPREHR